MIHFLLLALYSFLIALHLSAGGAYVIVGVLSLLMVLDAGLWRFLLGFYR